MRYYRPWADHRRRGPWLDRAGDSKWIRRAGKPHLLDGTAPILDPEFDWPDESWVPFHFETHCSIDMDLPYESRALFEPPSAA
jgi:hypothetical protein